MYVPQIRLFSATWMRDHTIYSQLAYTCMIVQVDTFLLKWVITLIFERPLGFKFYMKLYPPHSMETFNIALKNQYRDLASRDVF